MEYENICERLMRVCTKMEAKDDAFIAEAVQALKGFSEDELVGECNLCVGEAIRAHAIIIMCGEYLKAEGEEREDIADDIKHAARDFFDY